MPVEFEYRDPCLTIEDLLVKAGCQPSAVREAIDLFGPQFKNMDGALLYRGSESRFEGMTIEEFCSPAHLKEAKPHWFFADKIVDLEELAFGDKPTLKARGDLMKEVGPALYRELQQRWSADDSLRPGKRPSAAPSPKDRDRTPEGDAKANNPWSKAAWSITRQGQVVKALGLEKAAGIAKSAGSYIGATKPAA
ncbi:hypothetical protein L6654_24175 [Bradyrhizobium sp. WYCCWR 13023]|uniref:Uncharacterized protein n=1 Tax=Bradyrhizobium zhengyangense TaxID=2911009 RepID=A0A9X1RGF9_9BRAD|nr:hypothetical protein [Bradyrhizobium zhengyangense]MCG2629725.1 hypothetical protein [Bradyrhizobium zhengyangense]